MLFLLLLRQAQEKYSIVLHTYCLMTNHFHPELTTKTDPIWKVMNCEGAGTITYQ